MGRLIRMRVPWPSTIGLAAVNFDMADGLALTARAVFDTDLDLTKGEAICKQLFVCS